MSAFANNFEVNMTLSKIPFSDNYKYKLLKCIWNPNEKRWYKRFSKRYYPSFDNREYLDMINDFMISCLDEDIRVEYIEGLEELKQVVFEEKNS